jgi:hypothetical protein
VAEPKKPPYTCTDYREEMLLLALTRKLESGALSEEERRQVVEEIKGLEQKMGMG